MLYYLSLLFINDFSYLNVFKYLTFRSGGALLTSLIFSFLFAPFIIRWLKKNQRHRKTIREDVPNKHLIKKRGTPTMGGLLILISFVLSTLLWADTKNSYIWLVLSITFGFGAIGFIDDYFKFLLKKNFVKVNYFKIDNYVHIGSTLEYHEFNYWDKYFSNENSKNN